MAFILNRDKGHRMWGGGKNTFNSSRQGGGGSGAGGGGGVSSSWVDDNYVSKDYFNQLFKVKVAVRVLVTDPSTTPATVISDTSTVRQDLLYPNEVPASTTTTDEETGYVTSTTYSIDSIQVMGGVWTNSYVSALGQNSSGGGGGGGSLNEPLSSINMAGLSAPGAAQDGMTIVWDQATGRWKYGSAGAGSVTSVGMTVPTGFSVSPATITSTGTFAITFASGYSLPTTAKQLNWDKAYGWGNHATAGYALTSNVYSKTECDERFMTIAFFRSLFRAYTSGNTEVTPNAGDTSTIDNIKAMFGFWTNAYISALGQNSSGGGGGGGSSTLAGLNDVQLGTLNANDVLIYDGNGHWINTTKATFLSGYVTTSDISDMATKTWVGQQGFLTSNSFSALTTSNEKISATIGTTTRTVQAPTIADLGQNPEAASSSSTPATKFAGAKFGATAGLYLTEVYPSVSSPTDIPCEYGNMVNILGAGGGQLLAEWCGDYTTGHLYYRSHRDVLGSGGWTPWTKLAFTTDNVASATKLATARTLWGQSFDGTANVSGNMTDVGSITASGNIETSGNVKATKFYLSSTVYFQLDNDGNVQLVGAGLWTNSFLSALGQNSSGGGGATDLAAVWESLGRADGDYGTSQINISHLTTALSGYATTSAISDMATKTWVTNQGYTTNTGTVTSVAMSVPTGFDISGTPITASGTLALTFATGYSLPTTAKQLNWDTAYDWGDHSQVGYLTSVAFSDLTSHPTTLAGYGITDAKIASGVITMGTNTITPWTTNNHPTTLSGYGITDAVSDSTTWWGQSISSGAVSGSLSDVGSITSNTRGSIDGFNKIEFYSTTQSTGTGGGIYFHFPGVSGYSSAYIQEDTLGVLSLYKDVSINRDLTVGSVIYQSGNYIYMNKANIGLMIEGGITESGETRASFGFHTADGTSWQDSAVLLQLKRTSAERYVDVACGILRIGDVRLVWDGGNNALKIQKADGTSANLYATGGVSALGMTAGVSSIDAMTFNYVTINNDLTFGATSRISHTLTDENRKLFIGNDDNSGWVAMADMCGQDVDGESQPYWRIYSNGQAFFGNVQATRFYLDGTRYLYVSNGDLYYNNGSQSRKVAFTN